MNYAARVLSAAEPGAPSNHVERFAIAGSIDDQPVFAQYDGSRLKCARLLWEHANLVVAFGESFSCPEVPGRILASLEHADMAMFLTFARACDHVASACLTMSLAQAAHD